MGKRSYFLLNPLSQCLISDMFYNAGTGATFKIWVWIKVVYWALPPGKLMLIARHSIQCWVKLDDVSGCCEERKVLSFFFFLDRQQIVARLPQRVCSAIGAQCSAQLDVTSPLFVKWLQWFTRLDYLVCPLSCAWIPAVCPTGHQFLPGSQFSVHSQRIGWLKSSKRGRGCLVIQLFRVRRRWQVAVHALRMNWIVGWWKQSSFAVHLSK